jgi:hypothetical protein
MQFFASRVTPLSAQWTFRFGTGATDFFTIKDGANNIYFICGPNYGNGSTPGAVFSQPNLGFNSPVDAKFSIVAATGYTPSININIGSSALWRITTAEGTDLQIVDELHGAVAAIWIYTAGGAANANIRLGYLLRPLQAATASAPTYVKGCIYFDTTLNKLRIGGATAWETLTSA